MSEERKGWAALPGGLVVVTGIDFSEGSASALRESLRLVRHGLVGSIHAVHVVPESENHARRHPDDDAAELEYGQQRLRQFVTASGVGGDRAAQPPPRVGIHVRIGDPVEELHRVAAQLEADLLVIGPHQGMLLKNRPVGGVAGKVVQGAHCPVLVARPKDYASMKREPDIDPPCPQCVQARYTSGGQRWWCEQHANESYEPHLYSAYEEIPWAEHDSEAVPTGTGGVRM